MSVEGLNNALEGADLGSMGPLLKRAEEIRDEVKAFKAETGEATAEQLQRISDLEAEQRTLREQIDAAHAERVAKKAQEDSDELLKRTQDMLVEWEHSKGRTPSKAAILGNRADPLDNAAASIANFHALVARAKDYSNLDAAKDAQDQLKSMGARQVIGDGEKASIGWSADGKATVGDSSGAGGYLVPNAVIFPVIEQATARNPWRQELTVVRGVRGSSVQVPTEGLAPTRATIVSAGSTKTNANFTVASYTATLYTLAVIYDVGNQLLRQSEGAAEQLVRSRLTRQLALGESYYILAGSGSSEPKGILTSIGTSGTFVTSHTAGDTQAGGVAHAIAEAAGPIAARDRTPTAAVLSPTDFWLMLAQGSDNAGFFMAPAEGPSGIDATQPTVRVFGLRVFADNNMNAAGAGDDLIVGDFRSAQLFIGDDYRVDVSTEANDRWDKNLTGFRAEEEIAFNADPYVASGFFQRILDIRT
jgi:HK97 family phage major capsid protein